MTGHSALAVANGSQSGELRLIDVRDEDGELCRRVPPERAQRLVDSGVGVPHLVRGELRMVRLKHVNGSKGMIMHVKTWRRQAQQYTGFRTEYSHAENVCKTWHPPLPVRDTTCAAPRSISGPVRKRKTS